VKGKCSAHPDPRVQAVVEQVREAGMTQMIDRLRLLHNQEPKEVIILCSIPLDIEVDRLVTWEELAGNHRLNKLLDMCAAKGLAGLPLVPSWLTRRFPEIFDNPKSAENWLRNSQVLDLLRKSSNPKNAINSIRMGNLGLFGSEAPSEPEVATWRFVEYRPASRRGRWSNAAVCGLDARAAIAQALGVPESTVELRKPVWREPHIVEEPFADAIAIIVTTPKRAWLRPHIFEPSIKPLSFLELARPDEGEGVLLTELVCQSDWGPTHMPPQPAVH
jgi:hypothetical protein